MQAMFREKHRWLKVFMACVEDVTTFESARKAHRQSDRYPALQSDHKKDVVLFG